MCETESVNDKLSKLKILIEDLQWAKLRVDSIIDEMVNIKDELIFETAFKEEFLKYDECPIEQNDITYKSWRDDILKRFDGQFESGYIGIRNTDDWIVTYKAEVLGDLFNIYKKFY